MTASRIVAGYDLASWSDRQRCRRDAEDEALELAVEAVEAARKAVKYSGNVAQTAMACGAASQAWTALAALLNGTRD